MKAIAGANPEVTPAMMEAGRTVIICEIGTGNDYSSDGYCCPPSFEADEVARKVFLAMCEAQRNSELNGINQA